MRRLALVVLAFCAAIAPFPPTLIEEQYSRRVYPALQRSLTALSNTTPVAFFDGLLIAAALIGLVLLVRRGRVLNLMCFVAIAWIVFLATWGLNYRRVSLEERPDFDRSRLSDRYVVAVAKQAVAQMNRLHPAAHAAPAPDIETLARDLAPAMERAASVLGMTPPLPARPKQTWLGRYFVRAGIDGMTDPFFLETLLAPNLLEVEQPAAMGHEWGHLAGLAHEAEAGYFGWLTCMQGDARAQYSGWVALYPRLVGALDEADRKAVQSRLAAGPREDFRRIAARLSEAHEGVRTAANNSYDVFLRANRVAEGIRSYDGVVRLVVGLRLAEGFTPPGK
jgi:hypothetical protein